MPKRRAHPLFQLLPNKGHNALLHGNARRHTALSPMLILHSSDWHLGNRLMDHNRLDEFRAFFDWLLELMSERRPDVLLISGDVFDSSTPGDRAQGLLYDFLSRADATGCRRIILTAGNHDSAAQLSKAAPLLPRYHATVVASLNRDDLLACRLPLCDEGGTRRATLYAVPFLRPADVALPVSPDDPRELRETAYTRGIAEVYAALARDAREQKKLYGGAAIAMGHLSVLGTEMTASTRCLIGTLESVGRDIFEPVFDYVALGHIHKPAAPEEGRIHYCGSPLAMGLDEASYRHRLLWITVDDDGGVEVEAEPVPVFTLAEQVELADRQGFEALAEQLRRRAREANADCRRGSDIVPSHRVLLRYSGGDLTQSELLERAEALREAAGLELVLARRCSAETAEADAEDELKLSLAELTPEEVLRRRMEETAGTAPPDPERQERLLELFRSCLHELEAQRSSRREAKQRPASAATAASAASADLPESPESPVSGLSSDT